MLNYLNKMFLNWKNKGAFTLVALALLLPACTYEQAEVVNPEVNPDLEDVAEDTEELFGQIVTVEGEVEEIIGANAFTLQEEELFGGETILVVGIKNWEAPIAEEQYVQVTGEVRELNVVDFEQEYEFDWDLDLEREIEAEFQDTPVIAADIVQIMDLDE